MDTLRVRPERMKALEEYAQQLGKDPAELLDDALAKFLDYETWFARAVKEGIDAADRAVSLSSMRTWAS